MKVRSKMTKAIVVIGLLILIAPSFAMAQGLTLRANCDKGHSVQKVLDRLDRFNVPATIIVTGTCNENVVIKQDDVTIQGGNFVGPDPNQNTIQVQAARRVLITGVTVGGGYNGILSYQGASLSVASSTISGAANNGVVSVFGSSVTVDSSTIQGNLQGATAADNSAMVVTNSYIQNNTGTGVVVIRSSSARIGQNLRGQQIKNWITGNGGSGLYIGRSSHAIIDGNTIDNNINSGISIEGGTAAVINNSIRSNGANGIDIFGEGHARIGITEVNGYAKNYIENNGRDGVKISEASNGFLLGNDIKNNVRNGIGIYRGDCGLIGDNTIQGNQGHGMSISQGRLFQGKGDWPFTPGLDIITQNGYSGISGWNNASLDIHYATITNNLQNGIVLSLRSTLRIYDSTVSGHPDPNYHGIAVYDGSAAAFYHPTGTQAAIITGNTGWGVFCGGDESSYTGDISGVTGNTTGQVSCTGF